MRQETKKEFQKKNDTFQTYLYLRELGYGGSANGGDWKLNGQNNTFL